MKQEFEVYYKGHTLLGKIECLKKDCFKKAKELFFEDKKAFYFTSKNLNFEKKLFIQKDKKLKSWKALEKHLSFVPYVKVRTFHDSIFGEE